jgi:hypothetical protein
MRAAAKPTGRRHDRIADVEFTIRTFQVLELRCDDKEIHPVIRINSPAEAPWRLLVSPEQLYRQYLCNSTQNTT